MAFGERFINWIVKNRILVIILSILTLGIILLAVAIVVIVIAVVRLYRQTKELEKKYETSIDEPMKIYNDLLYNYIDTNNYKKYSILKLMDDYYIIKDSLYKSIAPSTILARILAKNMKEINKYDVNFGINTYLNFSDLTYVRDFLDKNRNSNNFGTLFMKYKEKSDIIINNWNSYKLSIYHHLKEMFKNVDEFKKEYELKE